MSKTGTVTMDKVVRPGTVDLGYDKTQPVFCHIRIVDGTLSITGVEGPMSNGDAHGSAGQIDQGYRHRDPRDNDDRYSAPKELVSFAPGWSKELWWDFLDVWKNWHLNDTNSACEHQQAERWGKKKLVVVTWGRTSETSAKQQELRDACMNKLAEGETVTLDEDQRKLWKLKWELAGMYMTPELHPFYEVDKTETKQSGWVYPTEHPDGVLTKPCPVCGHKYGHWLRRKLPATVIEFLEKLPVADRKPAWV